MKRSLLVVLSQFIVYVVLSQGNPTLIAFGSCDDERLPQEMWKEVIAQKPTLWIWGGDNVYADDNEPLEVLKARYDKQKSNPDYQMLLKVCQVSGTWDDHDYGINDGGRLYAKKRESKKYLLDFLGIDPTNPVWKHEGVYNSIVIGKGYQKTKVINLDTRYFRDTILKYTHIDTLTKKKLANYKINPTGDVLGSEQWEWLTKELNDAAVKLFIINSSIQVLAEQHQFEKWGNFPQARKKLLQLIETSGKKVLIISGDRHIAEFSKHASPHLAYPLYDFTSSGITHTWSEVWEEENHLRVGSLVIEKTFGLIKIEWNNSLPKITMEIKGLGGKTYGQQIIQF